jgi:hypothetical protein
MRRFAGGGEGLEVWREQDAREFALEAGGVAVPIDGGQSGSSMSFTFTFRVGATGTTAATDFVSWITIPTDSTNFRGIFGLLMSFPPDAFHFFSHAEK